MLPNGTDDVCANVTNDSVPVAHRLGGGGLNGEAVGAAAQAPTQARHQLVHRQTRCSRECRRPRQLGHSGQPTPSVALRPLPPSR
ncbi:hypothetical protein HU200_063262 [Digitaria exilis]|uniref:Uncharacterized protein n=1 Tax=Digitaria exilis TaxID=1010633 RepID=A0A835A950_9POAL|nr:hypothetical protein HU200_063262 [Digitaria exilis]